MPPRPVFFAHPSSLEHDTGGHPEQAARIVAIERELARRDWLGYERELSPEVSRATLERVHPRAYVDAIERASARGGGHLDVDTVVSSGSYGAALRSAGGAVALVDRLLAGGAGAVGFSSHRPPGHHALPFRAMGFCLFNNVAVAARFALDERGLRRVLIFDWDVHHGNGTNDVFADSDQVLFISIHESPLYPGTGAASDVGSGPGRGFTVNLPVPAGTGDENYLSLVRDVVVPVAAAFEPELVLISAGYDAHWRDPLADCQVTEAGFGGMARLVGELASQLGVPLGAVLEGGYDLGALAASVAVTMEVLAGAAPQEVTTAVRGLPVVPGQLAAQARQRLAEFWPVLLA